MSKTALETRLSGGRLVVFVYKEPKSCVEITKNNFTCRLNSSSAPNQSFFGFIVKIIAV